MERSRKITILFGLLIALSLLLNVVMLVLHVGPQTSPGAEAGSPLNYQHGTHYTLYIGTNDRESNTPVFTVEEAQAIVDTICYRYTDNFTSSTGNGSWKGEDNTLYNEATLIYAFYGLEEERVAALADEILAALNQNSLLIVYEDAQYSYYS